MSALATHPDTDPALVGKVAAGAEGIARGRDRRLATATPLARRVGAFATALEAVLVSLDGDGASEPVRGLRVTLRRMEATARVFRGFPTNGDGREVEERARTLRRALSARRRYASSLLLAGRFPQRHRSRALALLHAGRVREASRDDLRYDLSALLLPLVGWRDRLAGWNVGLGDRRGMLEKASRRVERARERLAALGVPDAGSIHEYRVALKIFRYRLEVVASWADGSERLLRSCRKLQKSLGDAVDWACLATDLPPGLPWEPEDAGLEAKVARERAAAERLALRALRCHRHEILGARLSFVP